MLPTEIKTEKGFHNHHNSVNLQCTYEHAFANGFKNKIVQVFDTLSQPYVDLCVNKKTVSDCLFRITLPELFSQRLFTTWALINATISRQSETVTAQKKNYSRKSRTISTCLMWSRWSGTSRRCIKMYTKGLVNQSIDISVPVNLNNTSTPTTRSTRCTIDQDHRDF